MTEYKPHILQYKKDEVADIKRLLDKYSVIGLINLEGLPAALYQKLKHGIKDIAFIKFARKDFMEIALRESEKKNIEEFVGRLTGVPALVFTEEDPFKLYMKLEKGKSSAPAKPGQKAPNDIIIPAGPTPFTPGPMIGELGQLGMKTEVKEGKIHIKNDKLIVKEGEEIKDKVAALLTKLGIEPMRIGLNLTTTYQNGEILTKDVLYIDEEVYLNNIKLAHANAFKLAYSVEYPVKEVLEMLIKKAEREAKALNEKTGLGAEETKPKDAPKEETSTEEKPVEPEVKEETPIEEPAKELEKPEEIAAPEEPKEEETKQEEQGEGKEKEQKHEASIIIENKQPVSDQEREIAENIARSIQVKNPITETPKQVTEEKTEEQKERDLNKIINQLKDKKSRGEI